MDALLVLTLEAHNPARNHHRRYSVNVGRDLFGHWTVWVCYGRMGQPGQEKRYGGPDEEALRAVVRRCLARRRSAPGRLGCRYEVTDCRAGGGVNLANWVPEDMLDSVDENDDGSASHRPHVRCRSRDPGGSL